MMMSIKRNKKGKGSPMKQIGMKADRTTFPQKIQTTTTGWKKTIVTKYVRFYSVETVLLVILPVR